MRDAQKKTQLVHRSKKLSSSDGKLFSLIDTVFGDDVDVLKLVIDPFNAEIYPQTRVWHQDTYELAQRYRNEFPRDFSAGKRGTLPHPMTLPYGYIENRVYWRMNHEYIEVYPPLYPGSEVTVYYTVYFHPFSSTAQQWANWFPLATNFMTAFTTQQLLPEVERLIDSILYYAVWLTLSSRSHPLSGEVRKLYLEEINNTIATIQNDAIGLTSPYRLRP